MLIGICEKCKRQFNFTLHHNGFGDSLYAYCNTCGKVAFFDDYKVPDHFKKFLRYSAFNYVIPQELEPYIETCECGGSFKHDSPPRCPYCKENLSPIEANKYIKSDHPNKEGWHWQNNWTGIYAIIIEDNKIWDNWKLFPPKLTFKERIKLLFSKKRRYAKFS